MFTAITAFFGGIFGGINKVLLIGAVLIIAVLGVMLGLSKYNAAKLETQIANLEKRQIADGLTISALRGVIDVKEFTNQQLRDSIKRVQERAEEADKEREAFEEKLKEILDAPVEDDGPVAPIIQRYLDSRRVQPNKG
jgi:uncharacterized protein (DUF2164 family)